MVSGRTAHNAAGELIQGSLPWRFMVQNTLVTLDKTELHGATAVFAEGSFNGNTVIL